MLDGRCSFLAGKRWVEAGPGEEVVVPPGTRHAYRNRSDAPTHYRCDVRPPSSLQAFLEGGAEMSRAGLLTGGGMIKPHGLIRGATLAHRHRDMVTLTVPADAARVVAAAAVPAARGARPAARLLELRAVAAHRRRREVAVRAVAHRRHALVVVRAGEALGVPDHVARRGSRSASCSQRVSAQRRGELRGAGPSRRASETPTCSIPIARVLSPTVCRHIQLQRHELVDRAVAVDDEVRAHARALAELDVGRVGGERVVGRSCSVLEAVKCSTITFGVEQPRAVERRSGGARRRASGAGGRRRTGSATRRSRGLRRGARRASARAPRATGDRQHRARVARARRRRQRARRQLDHERARAAEARVLPAGRGAGQPRQPPRRQPGAAGVGAHDRARPAPPREVHQSRSAWW